MFDLPRVRAVYYDNEGASELAYATEYSDLPFPSRVFRAAEPGFSVVLARLQASSSAVLAFGALLRATSADCGGSLSVADLHARSGSREHTRPSGCPLGWAHLDGDLPSEWRVLWFPFRSVDGEARPTGPSDLLTIGSGVHRSRPIVLCSLTTDGFFGHVPKSVVLLDKVSYRLSFVELFFSRNRSLRLDVLLPAS